MLEDNLCHGMKQILPRDILASTECRKQVLIFDWRQFQNSVKTIPADERTCLKASKNTEHSVEYKKRNTL